MESLRKKIEREKKEDTKALFWVTLVFGILMLSSGIIYHIKNIVKIGINLKYFQPTFLNAGMFYIGAIVFFTMSFFFYKSYKK